MQHLTIYFAGALLFALSPLGYGATIVAQAGTQLQSTLPDTLATIDGRPITLAEVRSRLGGRLVQIEAEFLRARSQAIASAMDALLREQLFEGEARRRGTSVDELLAEAAGPGGLQPTEAEIAAWYGANQGQVGGRSLDEVRAQIAGRLQQQRLRDASQRLEDRLRRAHMIVVHFEPYRFGFSNEGAPSLGTVGAPITVVEFSDFQCPFCGRFAPTLKRLAEEFGDDVFIVYRHFPIASIHPNAFKAAEASLCAHNQGRFWELHDVMFAEQDRLGVPQLKEKARRIGLDAAEFDACLDSGRFAAHVQRDFQEGQLAGVSGTPALFINGVAVPGGAVPYETVSAAIRRELLRVRPR